MREAEGVHPLVPPPPQLALLLGPLLDGDSFNFAADRMGACTHRSE